MKEISHARTRTKASFFFEINVNHCLFVYSNLHPHCVSEEEDKSEVVYIFLVKFYNSLL